MTAGSAAAPSKQCFRCLCEKPLTEFYRHSKMSDGRLNKCIECTKADVAQHRIENIERIREYDRVRSKTDARREHVKRVAGRWREEHPDRRAAQVAVGNAVRSGRLVPLPCLVCGAESEAHHPDYSRPLDVVWLCPAHHKQAHALHKKLLKGISL